MQTLSLAFPQLSEADRIHFVEMADLGEKVYAPKNRLSYTPKTG